MASSLKHCHRFVGYDYSRGASLFVTITTSPRRQLFGRVVDAAMRLSAFGEEVAGAVAFSFFKSRGYRLHGLVVMPDHVHFRFYLEPGLATPLAIASINQLVGRIKSYTTHLYQAKYGGHGVLWQEGFHDWLCLSREMIDAVERYIAYNPLKWELRNNRRLLRLYEPLRGPRFAGEYWRGLGAVGLVDRSDRPATVGGAAQDGSAPTIGDKKLTGAVGGARAVSGPVVAVGAVAAGGAAAAGGDCPSGSAAPAAKRGQWLATEQREARLEGAPPRAPDPRPLVALRVSRQCDARDIAELIARLKARVGGFTLMSGFVSPGERAVFEALLDDPQARLVKVSPTALAHDYQPPVRVMPAIADGRLAIIARGNSPEEISRATCLDLNARLVEMADFAAYQRHGRLDWHAKPPPQPAGKSPPGAS